MPPWGVSQYAHDVSGSRQTVGWSSARAGVVRITRTAMKPLPHTAAELLHAQAIADLDLTVGNDDPHHQPFDQLALLLPGGLIEPLPHAAAELLHAQANARNLALAVDLTLQLLHLGG